MVLKLLLLGLVIGAVVILGRGSRSEESAPLPPPSSNEPDNPSFRRRFRIAFSFAALAASLGVAVSVYTDWKDDQRQILIRVINAQNGDVSTYRALKKDLHMRTFRTLDGTMVTVADMERIEVEPIE
ncbi:MAG: hypothetical protein HQL50_11950 [Magnetococcales bacterium]|nr:hypothetical protein [Magnetococcales bacterium]